MRGRSFGVYSRVIAKAEADSSQLKGLSVRKTAGTTQFTRDGSLASPRQTCARNCEDCPGFPGFPPRVRTPGAGHAGFQPPAPTSETCRPDRISFTGFVDYTNEVVGFSIGVIQKRVELSDLNRRAIACIPEAHGKTLFFSATGWHD